MRLYCSSVPLVNLTRSLLYEWKQYHAAVQPSRQFLRTVNSLEGSLALAQPSSEAKSPRENKIEPSVIK